MSEVTQTPLPVPPASVGATPDRLFWGAPRARRRPWALPIGVGAAGLLAAGYTAAVDPNTSHAFPLCPLRAITGLDCPLCGGLRGFHSLAHGDFVGALDHNLLLPLILPVAVFAYALWLGRSLGWAVPNPRLSPRVVTTAICLLTAFGVLRNLPIPGHDLLNSTAMLAGRAS